MHRETCELAGIRRQVVIDTNTLEVKTASTGSTYGDMEKGRGSIAGKQDAARDRGYKSIACTLVKGCNNAFMQAKNCAKWSTILSR